jgi:acetoin utilization deacetylase AcuC-like enzyme
VIPFVWSDAVLLHDPRHEVWVGKQTPGTESPARGTVIREALLAAGHPELPAGSFADDALTAVHEPGLLEWLRGAANQWAEGPYQELVGQDRVVPYLFATPMMTAGMPWRYPTATHARAGIWCYDTMTLIGPGTWEAARAAADVALTAADLVAAGTGTADGAGTGTADGTGTGTGTAVYALCRPPGHHATPAGFGGSCYLNNAAIAAQRLAAGGRRVAVIDVDAHHGNGTQAIFWRRPDVFYGSVHVDPGAGWFPHVQGFADETGEGEGLGTTLNVPLPPGAGDIEWIEAVAQVAEAALEFRADALVVSLGLDATDADPESPLQVSDRGYAGAGRLLASLDLPTVLVQEGGYHLPGLGEGVVQTLAGFNARAK